MTAESVTVPRRRFFYGYVIVAAAFLVMVITSGTLYSYGVFVKPLIDEFGWSRALTSGAYSTALLLLGCFFIITGRLNDRYGPRRVLPVCAALLGIGYALMSQIHAAWQLYVFYGFFVSLGQSGSLIPMMSTVARWFTRRRGLMSGIVAAGVGVGQVIMPPLTTRLIGDYGWRNTYVILGSIAFVCILAVSRLLKRDPSQVGQFPDGAREMPEAVRVAQAEGIPREKAVHTRQLWMVFAIYLCYGFMVQGTMVHLVPHGIDMGMTPEAAAVILSVVGGVSVFGRIGMGIVGDRSGNRRTLIGVLIVALATFVFVQFAHSEASLFAFAALFGLTYGGEVALESPLVAETFGMKSHGALLGIVHFGATIGGAASPLLAGRIFDVTGRYETAFVVTAGFIATGLFITLLLKSPPMNSIKVPAKLPGHGA